VVNGKIYVIGGWTSEPNARALATVEEYDPATNTWTRKADMPAGGSLGDLVEGPSPVVDGKIYVIGVGDTAEVEEYDPSTDTWTRKADMPTRRGTHATVNFEGKIYVVGGSPPGAFVSLKTVEVYDPVTDTWARKADMPLGVALLNAQVVRGKIYAIGGRAVISSSTAYMQEYDPATDTWTRKADMLVPTSSMGSVVLGDKIVVIGGWLVSYLFPYATVQVYDPETDVWTREADVPFLRVAFSAEVVNNRIYVIGGTDRPHPILALSTVYEFGPLLDFNGDEIVGIEDLVTLIESWGTDNPRCDIAPLYGDGIVNVPDLEVLMSSWGQEVIYPTPVARWKLDETEGSIAQNSIGDNHGILHGEPRWQPTGGKKGGALQFDGIDDYISTDFVLSPWDGPFSALAWIKGGAPGDVIISQTDGAMAGSGEIWLGADAASGTLMTALVSPPGGRSKPQPLNSQSVVTDDQWHHIGFVWDGSKRSLYVDGAEAAKDATAQASLKSANGGLYFGADKTLNASSFFSGLVDDVRIYNRVVHP